MKGIKKVTYLNVELAKYLTDEAKRTGQSESSILARALLEFKEK